MNIEQLKSILAEYPPSMRLYVVVDGVRVWETTIMEVVVSILRDSTAKIAVFGRRDCIVRERVDERAALPEHSRWLELDLR